MATIRTILKKDSPSNNGKFPVYIRISDRGKRLHFATGFEASEKEFRVGKDEGRFLQGRGTPKFYVTRKENGKSVEYDNKEANALLTEMENRILSLIEGYDREEVMWTMSQLKDDFQNKAKRALFYQFALDVIESQYVAKNAFQRANIVQDALESFKKYDARFGKKEFQDITPKYIQGYINYWSKAGNSSSTIGMRLREIRRIYNLGIRDGVASSDYYPFSRGKGDGRIRIPKTEIRKADKYLTLESMKIIASGKVKKKILDKTRHLFLFSYYCRGINWKDMAQLTKENIFKVTVTDDTTKESKEVSVMQYRRSKTRGEFDIQVTPTIQGELDWFAKNTKLYGDFVLPIVREKVDDDKLDEYLKQSRRRFNRNLKLLAKELGLPESQQDISIYTARHSFAMTLQNKGKSVEIISQAFGHQSVETTKHYLAKFSTTKMAEETDIDLSE